MVRFFVMTTANEAGVMKEGSGSTFMLGMTFMSVAVMSLVIFGCGDCSRKPFKSGGGGGRCGSGGGYYGGGGGSGSGVGCGGGGVGVAGCCSTCFLGIILLVYETEWFSLMLLCICN